MLFRYDSILTMFGSDKTQYPLNVIYQSSNESSGTQKYIIQNVKLKQNKNKLMSMKGFLTIISPVLFSQQIFHLEK